MQVTIECLNNIPHVVIRKGERVLRIRVEEHGEDSFLLMTADLAWDMVQTELDTVVVYPVTDADE